MILSNIETELNGKNENKEKEARNGPTLLRIICSEVGWGTQAFVRRADICSSVPTYLQEIRAMFNQISSHRRLLLNERPQ